MSKRNVPQVRFAGFDGEWQQWKLGDISDVKTGPFGSTLHAEDYVDEGTPIITTEHFKSGSLPTVKNGIPQVSEHDYLRLNAYVIEEGDIVFSRVGSVDINALVTSVQDGWLFSGRVLRVQLCKSYSSQYLHFQLETARVKHDIITRAVGQTMPSINTEILKLTNIFSPNDVAEQIAIGNFHDNLDRLIALEQQKHDKLVVVKKSMLEKMFPKDGADVPEVRFARFSGAWERRKLGEVAAFSKGYGYSKGDLRATGTPIILYGRMYTNYQTSIDEVNTYTNAKPCSVYSLGQEVIVPASGESAEDIARASVVEQPGILLGGDLNIIRPIDDLDSVFLALTISSGECQKNLSGRAQGKSVVHLHNSDLEEIMLTVSSKAEQTAIGRFFRNLDETIALHSQKLEKLRIIKKSMLDKMFV